jgi:hypothetical protein
MDIDVRQADCIDQHWRRRQKGNYGKGAPEKT